MSSIYRVRWRTNEGSHSKHWIDSMEEFDSDFDLTRPGHPSERRKLTNIIFGKTNKTKKKQKKRNNEYNRIPFRHILPRYFSVTLRPSRMWQ